MEPWMIEQLRKQREEQRRRSERPRLRIQPPTRDWEEPPAAPPARQEEERGVWIIEM